MAILGFFTGPLLARQILRWIALLVVTTAKQGGDYALASHNEWHHSWKKCTFKCKAVFFFFYLITGM